MKYVYLNIWINFMEFIVYFDLMYLRTFGFKLNYLKRQAKSLPQKL